MAIDKIQSESINLADNFAFTGTVSGAGTAGTKLFKATMSGNNASVSDNTYTKVAFNTDTFDTDSVFDTSNNRFIAPADGKYSFVSAVYMSANSANGHRVFSSFYKNGSIDNKTVTGIQLGSSNTDIAAVISLNSAILDLSEDDYVEVYAKFDVPSGTVTFDATHSSFQGFKLI
tara:strand:+ start:891 stop:1412 length:522 start_codon:yes stop_codon:yes gene_type:complete